MDVATLAQNLAAFLTPFLPYLAKVGEGLVSGTGEMMSGKAWEKVQALWSKLRPKVEARPALQVAVKDVATKSDEDAVELLRLQLKKLLTEDATLAAEIAHLMGEAERDGITQNVLQHGKYNINIGKADGIDIGDKHQ